MWFKNLKIYNFSRPFKLNAEQFENKLKANAFRSCGATQLSSYGWVQPLGPEAQLYTHTIGQRILFCARREEKILPSGVINEALDEKLQKVENETGNRPRGKYRQSLKDEVIIDLLPRAFARSNYIWAYIDLQQQYLLIDTASQSRAEELVSFLRKTLESLPVVPLRTTTTPTLLMTEWLKGNIVEPDFEIGNECELREEGSDGAIVRCRRHDLSSEEIQTHLQSGKSVTRLAFNFNDRIECILQDDLSLRRLRFSDQLLEQAGMDSGEDPSSRLDADFNLMSEELKLFIHRLISVMGGMESSLEAA